MVCVRGQGRKTGVGLNAEVMVCLEVVAGSTCVELVEDRVLVVVSVVVVPVVVVTVVVGAVEVVSVAVLGIVFTSPSMVVMVKVNTNGCGGGEMDVDAASGCGGEMEVEAGTGGGGGGEVEVDAGFGGGGDMEVAVVGFATSGIVTVVVRAEVAKSLMTARPDDSEHTCLPQGGESSQAIVSAESPQ